MSVCVVTDSLNNLVLSNTVPCEGVLLVQQSDLGIGFGKEQAFSIFAACAVLYATVFIFKVLRKQLNIF